MIPRLALVGDWPEGKPFSPDVTLLASAGKARLFGEPGTRVQITDGVILVGFAFYRAGPKPCEAIMPREAVAIVKSTGEWAIRNLWGNYLLFWVEGDAIHILRSPMGGPAIFNLENGQGVRAGLPSACAFTDLAIARGLGFSLDRLDAEAVDARLRFLLLRSPACEIAGVTEILPGEVARLGVGRRLGTGWSPWHHVEKPPQRADPDALRAVVGRTISAWSGRFERLQLELSGGIDSSIVAACLAGRSRPWRGYTLATRDDADGDERPYAQAVAERVGVPLGEGYRPPVGDPIAPLPKLHVRPGGFGLLGPSDVAYLAAARDYGADAIFTGTGGDNVFGYMTSTAPILDALRFAGPIAAWRAANDLSRVANDNIWKALGYSARRMLRPPALWPVDPSLLSRCFADAVPRHPWIDTARGVAPGQQHYALRLLVSQPFIDGFDRALALPLIAPLLSQPIVEFTLGVPSWQWAEGGLNRAFARRAFRDDLPRKVIERTSKGRILSAYLPAYAAYRDVLRPFLLDGWLAGEGLLDVDALRALLDGREQANAIAMARILGFADMERWARAVTGA